jgi:hypothetical protein
MQQMFFIADLIACSTWFGHHYAHHQEFESIIQLVTACGLWCLVFRLSVWCGAEGCVSGLQAAEARKPDTQLLHLVGILFPHIHYLL